MGKVSVLSPRDRIEGGAGLWSGEDEGWGREGHSAETSDFLCLPSKIVTMPDPWQVGG